MRGVGGLVSALIGAAQRPHVTVVGSVNLDLVIRVPRLPIAGETIGGAVLERYPGGKGGNQALAAARLGAVVRLLACVGRDAAADQALGLLRAAGVDLSGVSVATEAATGVALIAVAPDGENQIVVAPGANAQLGVEHLPPDHGDILICQLEVPVATILEACLSSRAFVCVNLAPAQAVDAALFERADLLIVNKTEAQFYGGALKQARGWVAISCGRRGAELWCDGARIATAATAAVTAVDTSGAGDAFVAALALQLFARTAPAQALAFACAAGAIAVTRAGAQAGMPTLEQISVLLSLPAVR